MERLSRRQSVSLASCALVAFASQAWACDASIPESGSVVEWPSQYLAAEVKVLKVWSVSGTERRASVQVLRSLEGDLPKKFVVGYEAHSCGAFFAEGAIQISGFVLLPRSEWKRDYRFNSNSFVNSWVQAVFVDNKIKIAKKY